MRRSQMFVVLAAVAATLILVGCQQPTTEKKAVAVPYSNATDTQKAAVAKALSSVMSVVQNVGSQFSTTGAINYTSATATITGSATWSKAGGVVELTTTMTNQPDGSGSFVSGKVTMREDEIDTWVETAHTSSNTYTYTFTEVGDLQITGATKASVSFNVVTKGGSEIAPTYSGTVTVDGTPFTVDSSFAEQ